ncbi:gamma-glutamyltransferase [Pararhodospirillum oryzae]|uniref:Gamma-glutamyltranspeptidase n=1 Tax=Pararhodospirillum oryzae TaxID=478448 RepID=A0A512H645_9PROT|nr:gamma-glutamyltransferase [Pararhodospirillum oryzae]GEO80898.1 gamma-glutamyltranspeptidase [Pararhodospirillum oryzae]
MSKGRERGRGRQSAPGFWTLGLGTVLALTLAACADSRPPGVIGHVEGFAGVIAADEPQAVLVARDILSAGGTAADAATGLAFTLAVTLPSSAGLGGGGVCLAYDPKTNVAETLDFRATPAGARGAAGGVAVPALARGLFALQARFGTLRWESVVAPAENLARFGFPVPRALVQRLGGARAPGLPAGVVEGQVVALPALAATLGRVRQRGAGDLHDGMLARDVVRAAGAAGFGLTLDDLRAQVPAWRPASDAPAGYETSHRAVFGEGAGSASDRAGTSFVVADRHGAAVACALTMGQPFGTGTMLSDLGLVLAAPVETGLATMLVTNHHSHEFHLAVAATGPGAGRALDALLGPLTQGRADPEAVLGSEAGRTDGARVNVGSCPGGIPPRPETCRAATDPRGAGYALRSGT